MDMELIDRIKNRKKIREELREQGKSSFFTSVGHDLNGIDYTISHERNFRIEMVIAIIVSIVSFVLKVSIIEWLVLIITMALVLVLEMINTAIERSIDLITKEYRELAKVSKDVAAGAVLIMSMFSVVIGIIIFLPKIINLFG